LDFGIIFKNLFVRFIKKFYIIHPLAAHHLGKFILLESEQRQKNEK